MKILNAAPMQPPPKKKRVNCLFWIFTALIVVFMLMGLMKVSYEHREDIFSAAEVANAKLVEFYMDAEKVIAPNLNTKLEKLSKAFKRVTESEAVLQDKIKDSKAQVAKLEQERKELKNVLKKQAEAIKDVTFEKNNVQKEIRNILDVVSQKDYEITELSKQLKAPNKGSDDKRNERLERKIFNMENYLSRLETSQKKMRETLEQKQTDLQNAVYRLNDEAQKVVNLNKMIEETAKAHHSEIAYLRETIQKKDSSFKKIHQVVHQAVKKLGNQVDEKSEHDILRKVEVQIYDAIKKGTQQ